MLLPFLGGWGLHARVQASLPPPLIGTGMFQPILPSFLLYIWYWPRSKRRKNYLTSDQMTVNWLATAPSSARNGLWRAHIFIHQQPIEQAVPPLPRIDNQVMMWQCHVYTLLHLLKLTPRPPPNRLPQQQSGYGSLTPSTRLAHPLRNSCFQPLPLIPANGAISSTYLLLSNLHHCSCSYTNYQPNRKPRICPTYSHLLLNVNEEVCHEKSSQRTICTPLQILTLSFIVNPTPVPTSQPVHPSTEQRQYQLHPFLTPHQGLVWDPVLWPGVRIHHEHPGNEGIESLHLDQFSPFRFPRKIPPCLLKQPHLQKVRLWDVGLPEFPEEKKRAQCPVPEPLASVIPMPRVKITQHQLHGPIRWALN